MTNLKGQEATGVSERADLFTRALTALVTSEGGFLIVGCAEDPDIYVQFAWGPPALVFEVSGAGASSALGQYLIGHGFAIPDGAALNFSRQIDDPEPRALADSIDEVFLDGFGCPPDYVARIDELELD